MENMDDIEKEYLKKVNRKLRNLRKNLIADKSERSYKKIKQTKNQLKNIRIFSNEIKYISLYIHNIIEDFLFLHAEKIEIYDAITPTKMAEMIIKIVPTDYKIN